MTGYAWVYARGHEVTMGKLVKKNSRLYEEVTGDPEKPGRVAKLPEAFTLHLNDLQAVTVVTTHSSADPESEDVDWLVEKRVTAKGNFSSRAAVAVLHRDDETESGYALDGYNSVAVELNEIGPDHERNRIRREFGVGFGAGEEGDDERTIQLNKEWQASSHGVLGSSNHWHEGLWLELEVPEPVLTPIWNRIINEDIEEAVLHIKADVFDGGPFQSKSRSWSIHQHWVEGGEGENFAWFESLLLHSRARLQTPEEPVEEKREPPQPTLAETLDARLTRLDTSIKRLTTAVIVVGVLAALL